MSTSHRENHAEVSPTAQGSTIALHTPKNPPSELNVHGESIRPLSALNFKKNTKAKTKECQLLHQRAKVAAQNIGLITTEPNNPLLNTHYRDSCFFKEQISQLYIFPWETTSAKEPARDMAPLPSIKFNEFVLANCLFGANLRGIDDNGKKYPLIDHDLKVQDVITDIELEPGLHPYETMVFACFDKLTPLMKSISNKDFTLRYHLPVIDYMLYGLHSYISGIMSLTAFQKYVTTVAERGNQHQKILKNIAAKNNITLIIESPFDGLCDTGNTLNSDELLTIIGLSEPQLNSFKEHIRALEDGEDKLTKLEKTCKRTNFDPHSFADLIRVLAVVDGYCDTGIETDNSFYEPHTQDIRMLLEEICIDNILDRLKNSVSCPSYSAIWNTISAKKLVTSFSPLKQLFKVANTTVIACSQTHNSPGTVCSLLPVDEKPIPTSYSKLLGEHYGDVFCLSWLPPVFNYLNSPTDISTGKSNLVNNLFRFRSDLFELDQNMFSRQLNDTLSLEGSFWRALLSQTAESATDRSLTPSALTATETPAFFKVPHSDDKRALKPTNTTMGPRAQPGTSPDSPTTIFTYGKMGHFS